MRFAPRVLCLIGSSLRVATSVVACAALTAAAARGEPVTTAITYQGSLAAAGVPAWGAHDLRFRLYDAAAGGAQVGPELCADNQPVSNGQFAVTLDFGPVFAGGQRRFIEVDVRGDTGLACDNITGYTTLGPRLELSATPYSQYASIAGAAATAGDALTLNGQASAFYTSASNLSSGTLPSARLSGTYSGPLTLSNAGNSYAGTGSGLTSLSATNLTTGTLPNLRLSGTYTNIVNFSNSSNTFTGSGSGLTALNAGNLSTGTLPSARLSGAYASVLNFSNAANTYAGIGTGLTSLNASAITTGTLDEARLSSSLLSRVPTSSSALVYLDSAPVSGPGTPRAVAFQNGYAYAAIQGSPGLLQVFGAQNHTSIIAHGTDTLAIAATDVAISGQHLYASGNGSPLYVFSIATPSNPVLVGSVAIPATSGQLLASGGRLYLGVSGAINIYSLANPDVPTLAGTIPTVGGFAVSGNSLYLAASGTLRVYDVTNAASPVQVGTVGLLNTGGGSVATVGSHIAVLTYDVVDPTWSVQMINVANPAAPSVVSTTPVASFHLDMQASGNYLYYLTAIDGMHVLDVSNPASPVSATQVLLPPGQPTRMSIDGNFAVTTDTSGRSVQLWSVAGVSVDGAVRAAGGFVGDGGAVTNVDAVQLGGHLPSYFTTASNLTGVLSDARLSSNIPRLNSAGTFTAGNTFSGANNFTTGNTFGGNNAFNGSNTFTAANTFSGVNTFSGLSNSFTNDLGVGVAAPASRLHVRDGSAGAISVGSAAGIVVERNGSNYLQMFSPDASDRGVSFGSPVDQYHGGIYYTNAGGFYIRTGGNQTRMTIDAAGYAGFGIATPSNPMQLAIDVSVTGTLGSNAGGGNLRIGSGLANSMLFDPNSIQVVTSSGFPATLELNQFGGQVRAGANMHVVGTLSKGAGSFQIDHPLDPLNRFLYHSFVESPDMMNVYNGNVITGEDGYATIDMPDWFEALNRDVRYQLTVINEGDTGEFLWAQVVRKMAGNRFTIRTSRGGVEVSWQVTGIRQDAFANRNRIPTEVDKDAMERGTYLHPAAFDQAPIGGAVVRQTK